MTLFLNAVVAGVAVGALYSLIAVGYTVVFNATHIFNLAEGDLVMLGVMGSYLFLDVLHLSEWVCFLIVTVGVVCVSLVEERLVVRPFLRRAGGFGWFISTLAFSLVLEGIVNVLFGTREVASIPGIASAYGIKVGPIEVVPNQMLVLGVMLALVLALEVFYSRTRWGQAMRATAEDREVAALREVDTVQVGRVAFALGGFVAAVTGFVIAPLVSSNPQVGLTYSLDGFVALAIGGFGSMRGAVVGGIILGIGQQILDLYWNPGYELVAGLALLLVVLAVRPFGLFGGEALREV